MKPNKTKYSLRLLMTGIAFVAAVLSVSGGVNGHAVKRIEFENGKSFATVTDVTRKNDTTYVVRARSGQKLVLTLSSWAGVVIKVERSGRFGHTVLLRKEGAGTYTVGLEESGEYRIVVGSTDQVSLPFTLGVRIDRTTDI